MPFRVVLTFVVFGFILVTGEEQDDLTKNFEEAKKVAKMAKNFHETVGGNNITKTIEVGKKAYDKKKKIDSFLGRKEENPLKTAKQVLTIGSKMAGRK